MQEITERQQKVLEVIQKYVAENNFAPSIRNVSDTLGENIKASADTIGILERKGFIKRQHGIARSITIQS